MVARYGAAMSKRGVIVLALCAFVVALPPLVAGWSGPPPRNVIVTEIPAPLAKPVPSAAAACAAHRLWHEGGRVVSWQRSCIGGDWFETALSYPTIAAALREGPLQACHGGSRGEDGLPAWLCDWMEETL